jgi:SAM-dependent methyltransferase
LLAYVRHCGKLLGEVLTGKESPLETLFPGGSFELAEGLYQRSATMRYINALASSAFAALAETSAPGRRLRVMEVGAGTGGTTAALLPVLPPERTRYCYTDMSVTFFEQARKRFGCYAYIEYGLFDMEQDPVAQGYAPQSFDVIISANAVHASTDLRAALRRLHYLLAPGGVLILVESTTHLDWFDMTTGLIEGWQHFADDLRTDNPLLSPKTWIGALEEAGFQAAGAWPPDGSPAEILGQHVIVARVPGEAAAATAAADRTAAFAATQIEVAPGTEAQQQGWRELLDQALPGERLSVLQELVCARVMSVLRLDPASRPARHDRLMELGMDSLMAVQLRNALGTALALERPLPATLMFDYPTIDAIAAFMLARLAPQSTPVGTTGESAPVAAAAISARSVAAMSDDDIAKLLLEQMGTS